MADGERVPLPPSRPPALPTHFVISSFFIMPPLSFAMPSLCMSFDISLPILSFFMASFFMVSFFMSFFISPLPLESFFISFFFFSLSCLHYAVGVMHYAVMSDFSFLYDISFLF